MKKRTRPQEPNRSPRAAETEVPEWRCRRAGPVSGRYEGEMTAPAPGRHLLDLRVDIDPRYDNSPVMNRVSGDFYQLNRFNVPGRARKSWRVYHESWIV